MYRVPDVAGELALGKKYPYTVSGTTEHGAFPRHWAKNERHPDTPAYELQAGSAHLYTYREEDFALGVASRPFLDSKQHTAFHLTYRRRRPAASLRDITTMFLRFRVNEIEVTRNPHLEDQGRAFCVGCASTAMVLYHARLSWTADSEAYEKHAIHPLIQTNYGREFSLKLDKQNGYGIISLFNYQGADRHFSDIDFLTCMNGFVLQAGTKEQSGSFSDCKAAHGNCKIRDTYASFTGMREVRFSQDGLELEMVVSHVSEGIKYRAVNGRLVEESKFQATGLETSRLPFFE